MRRDWGTALTAFAGKKFLAPNRLHLLGFAALIPRRMLGRAFLTPAHPLFGTSLAFLRAMARSHDYRAASPLPKKSHRVLGRSNEASSRTPAALLEMLNSLEFASVRRQRRYPAARLQCPPHCAGRGIFSHRPAFVPTEERSRSKALVIARHRRTALVIETMRCTHLGLC